MCVVCNGPRVKMKWWCKVWRVKWSGVAAREHEWLCTLHRDGKGGENVSINGSKVQQHVVHKAWDSKCEWWSINWCMLWLWKLSKILWVKGTRGIKQLSVIIKWIEAWNQKLCRGQEWSSMAWESKGNSMLFCMAMKASWGDKFLGWVLHLLDHNSSHSWPL